MNRLRVWWSAVDPAARAGVAVGLLAYALILTLDIWFDIDYKLAADVALLAIALMVNTFTLLYGFRSKWRTNRIGLIYLAKCVVLSLVLDQIALSVWLSLEYPGRQYIRFAIYGLGAVVYIPMLVSLLREQHIDRKGVRQ